MILRNKWTVSVKALVAAKWIHGGHLYLHLSI